MPPISQPGSRAGLITTLVIFVVGTFAGVGGWVYTYVQSEQTRLDYEALKKKVEGSSPGSAIIMPSDQEDTVFAALKKQQDDNRDNPKSIFGLMHDDLDKVTKKISAGAGNADAAMKAATDAFKDANSRLNNIAVLPDTDLVGQIRVLAEQLLHKQVEVNDAQTKLAASEKAKQDLDTANTKAMADRDAQFKTLQAQVDQLKGDQLSQLNLRDTNVKDSNDAAAKQIAAMGDQIAQLNTQINQYQADKAKAQRDYKTLQDKWKTRRVDSANKEAMQRQTDGEVIKVAGDTTCFVNLGYGDHVTMGLTFEVYGKDGVPRMEGTSEDVLPKGKASIEIVNVGQNSSECRVIAVDPGMKIEQGDLIANLIYDRNLKFRFFIFPGDGFDFNQSGHFSPAGGAVIKQLVVRWGGTLDEGTRPDINTDFVVMGKEPEVPKLDPGETEPGIIHKAAMAKQALAEYQAVRDAASDMHIPILDQNRFLVLIGYYEMAQKGGI